MTFKLSKFQISIDFHSEKEQNVIYLSNDDHFMVSLVTLSHQKREATVPLYSSSVEKERVLQSDIHHSYLFFRMYLLFIAFRVIIKNILYQLSRNFIVEN